MTQRNQVPRQEMNINRVHICLCVVCPDANRLLNQGKHMRCQLQTQMVTGPIMTRLAFLILKCHCTGEMLCLWKPCERETTPLGFPLPLISEGPTGRATKHTFKFLDVGEREIFYWIQKSQMHLNTSHRRYHRQMKRAGWAPCKTWEPRTQFQWPLPWREQSPGTADLSIFQEKPKI